MLLYANQTSGEDNVFTITGEVVRHTKNQYIWGIANRSQESWLCSFPDGRKLNIDPGKGFPIYKCMTVQFSATKTGKIN
jgi:hypothetical protein